MDDKLITEAYQRLFKTADGKTVLEDLREGFYDVHTFNPHKPDKDTSLFLEGCRWTVGYILDQLKFKEDPEGDNLTRGQYI